MTYPTKFGGKRKMDGVDSITHARIRGVSNANRIPVFWDNRLTTVQVRDENRSSERKTSISPA